MRLAFLTALPASLLAAHAAMASPCPMMERQSKALKPEVGASAEGGIVVGEVPVAHEEKPNTIDRTKWAVRVNGKVVAAKQDVIAPGLVVYRPPSGAASWELVDGERTRQASAKSATTKQPLLPAPAVKQVISGVSRSRHPSVFVSVVLSSPAPEGAIAMVLSKSKGAAYSWSEVSPGSDSVQVYSTQGGCLALFPDGTKVAQPDEMVTAFWVDASGRRSRVSPVVVVEKSS